MQTNNLKELKKLVPVASARLDRNGVTVFGKVYYHRIEKLSWTGMSQSEFVQRVFRDIREKYSAAIEHRRAFVRNPHQ